MHLALIHRLLRIIRWRVDISALRTVCVSLLIHICWLVRICWTIRIQRSRLIRAGCHRSGGWRNSNWRYRGVRAFRLQLARLVYRNWPALICFDGSLLFRKRCRRRRRSGLGNDCPTLQHRWWMIIVRAPEPITACFGGAIAGAPALTGAELTSL